MFILISQFTPTDIKFFLHLDLSVIEILSLYIVTYSHIKYIIKILCLNKTLILNAWTFLSYNLLP